MLIVPCQLQPDPVARPCVLVVEDDDSIRALLEAALSGEGYEVVAARDGRAALELASRRRPGLILLDLRLPGMDGTEFVHAYRQLPGRHAPTIVLSASPGAGEHASELGADAFIPKPFDVDEVIRLVDRYSRRAPGRDG
ncbi:MAG: response regulator [Chloroflexota bacterium]|nr:response regulator [Chloroflexota bacterium]